MMEQDEQQDKGVAADAAGAPTRPLWLDRRRIEFRVEFDNGPLIINAPRVLTPSELDDLDSYFSLIATGFHRRAQAIEAHNEGAVPNGDAPHA